MDRFSVVKYVILPSILVLGISIIIANYMHIWATEKSGKIRKELSPQDDIPIFDEQGRCIAYDQFSQKNLQGKNGQQICLRYDRGNRQFAYGTSEEDGWQFFCGYRGPDGKDDPCFRVARGGKYEPHDKYYCGHHNPNFAFTVVVLEDLKNPELPTYIVQNDMHHVDEAYGSPENFLLRILLRSFEALDRRMQLIHEETIEDFNFILIQGLMSRVLKTDQISIDFYENDSKIPPPDLTIGNPDDFFLYYVPVRNFGFYVGKSQVDRKVIEVTERSVTEYTSTIHAHKFIRVPKRLANEMEFFAQILFILASSQPKKVKLNGTSVNLVLSSIEPEILSLENMNLFQKISQLLFSQKFTFKINGDIDWTFNPFEGGENINLTPLQSHLEIKSKGKIRKMTLNEVRNFLIKMHHGSEIKPRDGIIRFQLADD